MLDYIKEVYASTLETVGVVTFYDDDGFFYEIFESDNGGYMVEVFEVLEDEVKTMVEVDGGLCNGSAFDAIGFLINEEE